MHTVEEREKIFNLVDTILFNMRQAVLYDGEHQVEYYHGKLDGIIDAAEAQGYFEFAQAIANKIDSFMQRLEVEIPDDE